MKQFNRYIRWWDDYASHASFTYKGEASYGTYFGGCASIVLKFLTLVFFSI